MDPHIVFDCQKVLPNRFALTLAAAARSRALARGAAARLEAAATGNASDLALREIAAGAFEEFELAPFRSGAREKHFLSNRSGRHHSRQHTRKTYCRDCLSRGREAVVDEADNPHGGRNDVEVSVFQ